MNLTYLIKHPLITEKTMQLAGQHKYTFAVDPQATKLQIKTAVAEYFKVKVLNVSTANMTGKSRRRPGKQTYFQKSDWKKAIVEIANNQKIDLFDVEAEAKHTEVKPKKNEKLSTKATGPTKNQDVTTQKPIQRKVIP